MIVNNLAADLGGAIMLDDSSSVAIINNTIANNVTTGLVGELGDRRAPRRRPCERGERAAWQTDPRYAAQYPNAATRPDFSNPVALFNNIFWNNDAITLDQFGPGRDAGGPGLHRLRGVRHDEQRRHVHPALLRPHQRPDPGPQRRAPRRAGGQGNVSADPLFVTPFVNELTVSGARLDPQQAIVSITATTRRSG